MIPKCKEKIDSTQVKHNEKSLNDFLDKLIKNPRQLSGDYNTMFTEPGIYKTTSTTNSPIVQSGADSTSNWFTVVHFGSGNYQQQIAFAWFSERVFYRNCISGQWQGWKSLVS